MNTKLTTSTLLRNIQRSRLISESDLEELLAKFEAEGVDFDDPQQLINAMLAGEHLTEWQANHLLQGKHRGFFLGPYRFLSVLGKGGMGAVYLVEHEMMRRRCAIKVLPQRNAKSATSLVERFYREAQAVAALDHPNIVRAYDVNKDGQGKNEVHYLVMEYVEGQDLQVMVDQRGQGLDVVDAVDFTRQAAKGLDHAHENNLIHRDIKPANLLVDKTGCLKVLDLGLARFFDDAGEEASLTKAHGESTLGTADYLSPEQALDSHNTDTRTDIYSLGCTLYFMLTGRAPFPEGTVAQRLLSHQTKAPKPVEQFRSDVPSDLVAILDRTIAKKPEDRYQTAGELATVLSAWLDLHTNDEWKKQHPNAVAEARTQGSQAESLTLAISDASQDTNMDLDFAPDEDDEPDTSGFEIQPAGEDSGVGTSQEEKSDSVVELSPALSGVNLEDLSDTSLLDDLEDFDAPAAADPLTGPISTLSRPAQSTSKSDSENSTLFWAAVIGGPSIVLLVLVIIIAWPSGDEPVAATNPSPSEPASPSALSTDPRDTQTQNPAPSPAVSPSTENVPRTTPSTGQGTQVNEPNDPNDPNDPNGSATSPAPESTAPKVNATPPTTNPNQAPVPPTANPTPPTSNPPTTTPTSPTAKPPKVKPDPPTSNPAASPQVNSNDPPKPNLTPAERRKQLWDGISEVAIHFTSDDRRKTGKVNLIVLRLAVDSLEDAGFSVKQAPAEDSDPAVFKVNLGVGKPEQALIGKGPTLVTLTMTGELSVADSGSRTVIWSDNREVASLRPDLLRRDVTPPSLRGDINKFFQSFVRDAKTKSSGSLKP